MTNAVVTWASGDAFCRSDGFQVYLQSLSVINNAEFHILTHDMPGDVKRFLESQGIQVTMVPSNLAYSILRDRHLGLWTFLNESQVDMCLFTDSRDLYFQRNPFHFVQPDLDYLILVCEGMEHAASPVNMDWQRQIESKFREFKADWGDQPVLNGGVMMGRREAMKDLALLLWTNTVQSDCIDQGVLNYLWRFLGRDKRYRLHDPRRDPFCVTGEAICHNLFIPLMDGTTFCHPASREPYYIVHQWDRTSHKDAILGKYVR